MAELDADYDDSVLILRTACRSEDTDILDCDYSFGPGVDRVEAVVAAGTTYYVIVDSFDDQSGAFTLALMAAR